VIKKTAWPSSQPLSRLDQEPVTQPEQQPRFCVALYLILCYI